MKRWTTLSAIAASLAGVLSVASPALAQPPPDDPEVIYRPPVVQVFADLIFVLDPKAASSCRVNGGTMKMTTEDLFRILVEARAGEAFKSDPRSVYVGRVEVEVLRIPLGLAGRYVWERTDGSPKSRRSVVHGATPLHCKELLDDFAISLASYFNMLELELGEKYARKAPPSPACTTPAAPECLPTPPASRLDLWPPEPPLPPLRKPEPDPPKPRERWPIAFRVGAGGWADLISTDRGSLGITLDAGVRLGWFSVSGELRWDPSLGTTLIDYYGRVSFSRVTGALLLCGHVGWFVGCGAGVAGRLLFPGTLPPQPAQHYTAVGVRLGMEAPVAPPWFFLRVSGDVLLPIDPVLIVHQTQSVFQVSGWNAGIGIGALFEIGKR